MPIKFYCSSCGKGDSAPDGQAGRRIRCPACMADNTIPGGPTVMPVTAVAMPDVAYRCPHCDASLNAPAHLIGQVASCRGCGGMTVVPDRTKGARSEYDPGRLPAGGPVSLGDVTTPLLISAISNLLIGLVLLVFLIGIFWLVLCAFEFDLYRSSGRKKPGDFADSARTLSYFQIVLGVFNWISLACGILVYLSSGRLRDALRAGYDV